MAGTIINKTLSMERNKQIKTIEKQKEKFDNHQAKYNSNGTEVTLSPTIVREYLTNGDGCVTDQEVVMFINLCKAQGLNPFLREAYLIKFGNQPATIITGKDVFTKRARRAKDYRGYQAGVVVSKPDGTAENRIGSIVLPDEELVGGWAKVFIENYVEPVEISVSMYEYIGLKKDGTVNAQWARRPATMIRKVALVQALREAFPEELQGLYDESEMGVDVKLNTANVTTEEAKTPKEEPTEEEKEEMIEVNEEMVETQQMDTEKI